jgi:hypothetical protein
MAKDNAKRSAEARRKVQQALNALAKQPAGSTRNVTFNGKTIKVTKGDNVHSVAARFFE